MKYIFLDIDGVFNAQRGELYKGESSFYPKIVKRFNKLLEMHPDAQIVISSAWRYMVRNGSMTVKGFEEMLMSHGIQCLNKIVGVTPDAETFSEREREIEMWLQTAETPTRMVIIDDCPGRMCFTKFAHVLVRTNGMKGMSEDDVSSANVILSTPFQFPV